MGRAGLAILIISASFFATIGLCAQEASQAIGERQANAIEASGSANAVDQIDIDKSVELNKTSLTPTKKGASLAEEFFSSPLNYILILIVCFYFYLMFVMPRGARRAKKIQIEKLNSLKKNDRVVTSSGIHGIVSNIDKEAGTVTLRVDENSNAKLTIDRDSIRSVAN